jgi:hypothetical protein
LAKIRPYDGPTDFLKENQQQQTQQIQRSSRPMSVDIKRQSFNAYGGGRSSNRNSMRSKIYIITVNRACLLINTSIYS